MQQDRPTPDDIDELLRTIETADATWDVTDWRHQSEKGALSTVTIEVTWRSPADADDTVLSHLRTLDDAFDGGVPSETVVDAVAGLPDWSVDDVETRIEQLRRQGEVYEPSAGRLKTT